MTQINGRSVTVNGVTTQIAGLDISGLSDTERQAFNASLRDVLRDKDVLLQPVAPGISRLWTAGEPGFKYPKLMVCAPAIPIFIPLIVPARPDRIDVARELLSDGLARTTPEEAQNLPSLPAKSNVFFVPQFPLRLGKKAYHGPFGTYESVEASARERRVGIFATEVAQLRDEPNWSLRQDAHYAAGTLPDFE